jgi:hypothetical protein
MAASTVYVTELPEGRLTVSEKSALLVDGPAVQDAPAPGTQVQVQSVNWVGMASLKDAPVTSLGPLLVTVMVYVNDPPGEYVEAASVFVTLKSALGVTVMSMELVSA